MGRGEKEVEEQQEGVKEEKGMEEMTEVEEERTVLSVKHSTTSSLSCCSGLPVAVSTLINICDRPLTFDLCHLLLYFAPM